MQFYFLHSVYLNVLERSQRNLLLPHLVPFALIFESSSIVIFVQLASCYYWLFHSCQWTNLHSILASLYHPLLLDIQHITIFHYLVWIRLISLWLRIYCVKELHDPSFIVSLNFLGLLDCMRSIIASMDVELPELHLVAPQGLEQDRMQWNPGIISPLLVQPLRMFYFRVSEEFHVLDALSRKVSNLNRNNSLSFCFCQS